MDKRERKNMIEVLKALLKTEKKLGDKEISEYKLVKTKGLLYKKISQRGLNGLMCKFEGSGLFTTREVKQKGPRKERTTKFHDITLQGVLWLFKEGEIGMGEFTPFLKEMGQYFDPDDCIFFYHPKQPRKKKRRPLSVEEAMRIQEKWDGYKPSPKDAVLSFEVFPDFKEPLEKEMKFWLSRYDFENHRWGQEELEELFKELGKYLGHLERQFL